MNSIDFICAPSANGSCVALCSPDGVIKFYDTLTSTLKLEYSSSTHLQAVCTCMSWSKNRRNITTSQPSTKSKKNKTAKNSSATSSLENELNDLDLIAIGTSQGSIILYSLSKAAVHSEYTKDGHSEKVNDITWCSQYKDALFSCSDDGYVIEWSLVEAKLRHKWETSKNPVTALAVDSSSKILATASKTVTIWDLESRDKLKTLTGHSNDIFSLVFSASEPTLFLSAASNDRVLNLWSTAGTNAAIAAFNINDGPVHVDMANIESRALVCAVTSKGQLFIYDQSMTDKKLKKPVKAIHQIVLETHEGSPLPVLGAFIITELGERLEMFTEETGLTVCLIYGSHVNPVFEKMKLADLKEQKILLKRDDPFKTRVGLQTQTTKIETPQVGREIKIFVPGNMAPASKRKSVEPGQMTLEERLNVLGIESTNGDSANGDLGQIPKTDNLLVLLVQGLQSNDAKMLNHVLQHKNEKVVAKTVRMLPSNHIISLVRELNKRLQGHAQGGIGTVKWLKCVLMIHTSYLMSYPDLVDSLGSVYEMMNARTKLFPQLSKLQGKLQLVMSQVASQAETLNQAADGKDGEPLLLYQDSNSEDEQFEEELIPSNSDFDEYLFSEEEEDEEPKSEEDLEAE